MYSIKVCWFLTASFLLLTLLGDPTDACSCGSSHPQSAYCHADVVIRAKFVAVSKEQVNVTEGEPVWWTHYEIKTTKVYKGPEEVQDLRFLRTYAMESVCGYVHKGSFKGEEYVIAGSLQGSSLMITACSFIQPWAQLTPAQKRGLSSDYAKGCNCTIIPCLSLPCFINANHQCLWTDGLMSRVWDDFQAKRLACLPRSDNAGLCTWQSLNTQRPGSLRRTQ